MTNNWTDIGNSSCVVVMGANPSENHPACMAHINHARAKGAKLIVIDPRQTRTARQADRYIRIRPGTDIAFINGVVNYIITEMESRPGTDPQRKAFFDYLNHSESLGGRPFYSDAGPSVTVAGRSFYSDARFILKTDGSDYDRETYVQGSNNFSSFPKIAATVDASADTVYNRLKAHVAPYDAATVADICGCTEAELAYVANAYIDNSRCSSSGIVHTALSVKLTGTGTSKLPAMAIEAGSLSVAGGYVEDTDYVVDYSSGTIARKTGSTIADGATVSVTFTGVTSDPRKAGYTATTMLYAMGLTQHTHGAQNVKSFAVLQTLMGNMGRAGGGINALRGIHNVQGSTDMGLLYHLIPGYSGNPTLMPSGHTDPTKNDAQAFGKYMDGLWGNPQANGTAWAKVDCTNALSDVTYVAKNWGVAGNAITVSYIDAGASQTLSVGVVGSAITVTLGTDGGGAITSTSKNVADAVNAHAAAKLLVTATPEGIGTGIVNAIGPVTLAGGSAADYGDAYSTTVQGLQQRGFWNMTHKFFGDTTCTTRAKMDAIYALWPKSNGDDHVTMFRKMGLGTIRAAVAWGQNPAVTEPNQSAIRAGLYNLDLLVVADLFETETAACDRKDDSVTYLIPTCSYVEEAGSVVNSGRVLQWRERATKPKGNSKADLELLLRFAKALDDKAAFSHISAVWTTLGLTWSSVYDKLYGTPYGWTPGGSTAFEDISGTAEIWRGDDAAPSTGTVYGSEWASELMYREMCTGTTSGGTMWIYTGAYNASTAATSATDARPKWQTDQLHPNQPVWQVFNRAKSRYNGDPNGTLAYPGWGYAWLVNRRVLYNQGEIPGDVADFFMGPDSVGRLFVSTNTSVLNYSRWYRKVHTMADKPDVALAGPTAHQILPGRFPGHTEPYETPRQDLAAIWGRNTKGTGAWDLLKSDTLACAGRVGDLDASGFPLVLTTIRCVEHFQGGPITRNNPWNVEAEPYPWIEINSLDAAAAGIVTGDWVNVITARSDSIDDQEFITTGAPFADGFMARVGVGLQSNQRVGRGVVAIPWHWGDKGLSTGSRANDLCIDAGDANTVIPEYKACLCKIEKAT